MKSSINNYFFSNFENKISPRSTTKNSLSIRNIYNLTTENNVIEPLYNFSNLLKYLVGAESYSVLFTSYYEIINNCQDIIIYEFFNDESGFVATRIFLIDKNYKLYEIDVNQLKIIDFELSFLQKPKILKIENKLYLYNYNDLFLMISDNSYPLIVSNPPNISSYVNYHGLSLFSVIEQKFSIFVATVSNFIDIESNLSPYSCINLCPELGEVKKIIIYKDNLYVIQQFGISKITVSNNNFKLQSYCSIQSEIYEKTIALIDDFVIFYTTSGLYIFDGNDIKQIFKNVVKNFASAEFIGITFNNKYYIKTRYYINDIAEHVIIEFDVENDCCNIFKIGETTSLDIIQTLNHYYLVTTVKDNNSNYKILYLDKSLINQNEKYIQFNKLSFDDNIFKVVNEIKIQAIGSYKVIISSDIQSSYFELEGDAYVRNIGLKGQIFEMEIKSDRGFLIESILLRTSQIQED